MKNLKNALLLKQLYLSRQLGYRYTSLRPFIENEPNLRLPRTLEELKKQAKSCHLCNLSKNRSNVVFGEGKEDAKLMIISDAPSVAEDSVGRPFVGKTGDLFTKMVENVLMIKREDVYISNIVKCKTKENKEPTQTDVLSCQPYLLKQIEIVKPNFILTMGNSAYQYFNSDNSDLSSVRGTVIEKENYKLIPTYHPSYLLKNPSAKKDVFNDLKMLKALMDIE